MNRPTLTGIEEKYKGYLKPNEMWSQYAVELEEYCDALEKALDKTCKELYEFVESEYSCSNDDINGEYPMMNAEQWKEWATHSRS